MILLRHDAWALVVLGVVLVASAIADVRTGRIPNLLTYPAVAVGFLGHTLIGGLTGNPSLDAMGLGHAALGFAVGFGPLLIAWLAGGIGGGDAKLMGAVGALTGWNFTLRCMFWGFAVAGVMAIVIMLRKRILKRTLLRIWRFFWIALTPGGKPPDPAAPDSPKLAFGLALCIGSGIALVEHIVRGGLQ